ncbi:MAG: response regulator transcription factor [Bacteroidetes bacterium]|nr:response regulator transcription factor [Bacteroidota bacterium]
MKAVRILLVDDHNIILNGIKTMLAGEQDFEIVGEANNGRDAVTMAESLKPDVILMDIKMPDMNGIEATREITGRNLPAGIVGLTMFDDDEYIAAMLQAGAKGYLLKNSSKQDIMAALKRVATGETYFSNEVTTAALRRMMNGNGSPKVNGHKDTVAMAEVPLTKREIEILTLIADELTNLEIAERLFISQRTVHSHRRNLMQKIGVKNTAGLVRYALEHKLLKQ